MYVYTHTHTYTHKHIPQEAEAIRGGCCKGSNLGWSQFLPNTCAGPAVLILKSWRQTL